LKNKVTKKFRHGCDESTQECTYVLKCTHADGFGIKMSKSVDERISKSLKNLIGERGYKSTAEFARDLKRPHNTIACWLNRTRIPNSEAIDYLADFFEVSTDVIFGRDSDY